MSTAAEKTGVQTMDGGPVFPTALSDREGITLRDWFAGQALAGLAANPKSESSALLHAMAAYAIADRMLAERAKAGAQ
ncbi:hypothetical protein [Mesorhizobium ciceri]|uniref:hypothetical protein n=1 Tax=Mesorhizobium TaxID=68287 RepID=UPI0004BA3A3E|nr:hypothetical protein [Mesorhizobium ciceri]